MLIYFTPQFFYKLNLDMLNKSVIFEYLKVQQQTRSLKMETYKIIFSQLGGNKFLVTTGSKNLLSSKNGLSMHLAKNKSGAKYLEITLAGDDTYTLKFTKLVKSNLVTVKLIEGVYCDNLQSVFTEVTGLYTHL